MNSHHRRLVAPAAAMLAIALVVTSVTTSVAQAFSNEHFQRVWERTDYPVEAGEATRTWMWGPAVSDVTTEDYQESPDGVRTVQYFDKARMEITQPAGDSSSDWYVTNGLLVVEMIEGQMQVGDDIFQDRVPAMVNVAGDANDPNGPTYASFSGHLEPVENRGDAFIVQRIDRDGNVRDDSALEIQRIRSAFFDDVTGHNIAGPFWAFMSSSGMVHENGENVHGALFENPFYATGRPITEAYWADVAVGGTEQLVLVQCFERRCLTYTPDNAPEWTVEAGNVGQHYYAWRYARPNVSGQLLFVDRVYSPRHDSLVSNISLIDFAPDGLARINLTNHTESDESSPAWSPDGSKIAFARVLAEGSQIFVMDAGGSNQVQLTDDGSNGGPAWSPDGSQISFVKRMSENETHIFVMDADGSNQRQLTFIPPPEYGNSLVTGPDWSPDGTKIAFSNTNSPPGPGPLQSSIYIINVDGADLTELAQSRGPATPSWSPDGEKIAYELYGGPSRDFEGGTIFVIDADGSNVVNLKAEPSSPNRNDYHSPAWSPDSSKIAYAQAHGIFVTDPDGSNQVRLAAAGSDPTWSPNGQHIAFSFNYSAGLVVMDSDGGNLAHLTSDGASNPVWRP